VGHVEGGLHGAPIGVEPPPEEVLVELLVQIVDSIVEGKEDELGDLVSSEAPGDVLASTVAIRDLAIGWVAVFCRRLPET